MVGLSESRFAGLYKNFYGISPINDLIRARVNAAVNALENTGKSISEIAESLGYNNLPHFIRQFHSIVGMSPASYRKDHLDSRINQKNQYVILSTNAGFCFIIYL